MRSAVYGVMLVSLLWQHGCGSCGSTSSSGSAAALGEGDSPSELFQDLHKQLDLHALAHLADLDHQGLYIDFGTPARHKYTLGNWRSGWGRDRNVGGESYSHAISNVTRVYFPLAKKSDLTLRIRAKGVGSKNTLLFLNGTALPSLNLSASDFQNQDIKVPASATKVGENYLLMRPEGTTKIGGENVSMAVASLSVFAGSVPEAYQAPSYEKLIAKATVGGAERGAINVTTPATLSWYIDVPKNAKLGFGVGLPGKTVAEALAKVTVTSEGAPSKELYSEKVGARWQDKLVSLSEFTGRVVRLDFQVENEGKQNIAVAWNAPAIYTNARKKIPEGKKAKNLVLLVIDTLRADALSPYNKSSRVKTPILDSLSKEGAVFLSAQSPENWTKPSVASILTSLHPSSHGTKSMEAKLSSEALMLSEVYKKEGFRTGSFIANGHVSDRFGFKQGWDYYTNYIREKKNSDAKHVFDEAGAWIEKNKDKRFFAYLQTIDPHVPYDPPDEFLSIYDKQSYDGVVNPRKTAQVQVDASRGKVELSGRDKNRLRALYDGEISYHDHQLGLFVERLKKLGLHENTLFVITSDHGEEFGDHDKYGHGHSVYQELLHVPLSFWASKLVPSGVNVPQTVSTLDIAPTVLELTGVLMPDTMEGHSLVPYMHGQPPSRPAVAFSDFLENRRVIRAGDWKLIVRGGRGDATLFNVKRDPQEKKELSMREHPIAWRHCRVLLGQFLGATDRAHWIAGKQKSARKQFKKEDAKMDDELRKQLCALGYGNCAEE